MSAYSLSHSAVFISLNVAYRLCQHLFSFSVNIQVSGPYVIELIVCSYCIVFTSEAVANCLSLFGNACLMCSSQFLFFGEFAYYEYCSTDSNAWWPLTNPLSFESVWVNIMSMWYKSKPRCKWKYVHYLTLKWLVSFHEHCQCHYMHRIHAYEGCSEAGTTESVLKQSQKCLSIDAVDYPAELLC